MELSGIKNSVQADQAEKLRSDKERLLERLKQEVCVRHVSNVDLITPLFRGEYLIVTSVLRYLLQDKRYIELSEEERSSSSGDSIPLLPQILEPTLAKEEDFDCIRVLDGDNRDGPQSTSVSSRPLGTNGHGKEAG